MGETILCFYECGMDKIDATNAIDRKNEIDHYPPLSTNINEVDEIDKIDEVDEINEIDEFDQNPRNR